jgi:hypothetical protein
MALDNIASRLDHLWRDLDFVSWFRCRPVTGLIYI